MSFLESIKNLNPFDTLSSLFNTGYSIYQDQRNYNYTKDLQNQLFARDDTAMQRRMQDYKKAGINPLMALGGSGAGNTSAGSVSSTPVSFEPEFFTKQQSAKLQREAIRDEMDKRKYEKELLSLQLKSGKIANLQALQDLNIKQLEYRILQNQIMDYDKFGYYPTSQIGKSIFDVSQIINGVFPGINPLNPMPQLLNYVKDGIIDNTWIDRLKGVQGKVQDFVDNLTNTENYNVKPMKHPLSGQLYKVQQNFNRMNNTKYRLDFVPDSKFSNRGVLKLYNKRTKKYESPSFVDLNGVIRWLNYGSYKS